MILYMYLAPGQGLTTFWDEIMMSTEHLVISVICCKFQKHLFEVRFYTFIHHFIHVYIRLIISFICCKFQKKQKSLESDFLQFFCMI